MSYQQAVQHILLVRHGQTDANRDGIVQGHQPTPLNELGQKQALVLAHRLLRYRPAVDVLVSSDLLRARQTAGPIAAALGLPVKYDSSWRERCYGIMEGKNAAERVRMRDELAFGDGLPPGAQSADEYQNSILQALDRVPNQYPGVGCIAIVTHAGAVRAVTMKLTADDTPREGSYKPCPNCSITHLTCTMRDGVPVFQLLKVHDVEHLDVAQTTSRDSG